MAESHKAPRGTADVLPDEAARRDALTAIAAEVLGAAGYERIETPVFENTELFQRGVGASTNIVRKEMYTFTDAGDRSLTLRPEGTASVARSFIEHGMHRRPQPVKLWYAGPFFRYERAQAGRQRQFAQIGAEVLGSDAPAVDAESIVLLDRILRRAGCRELRLRLGSLGSLDARANYRERLIAYLRENESSLAPQVAERIDQNPLRAFDAGDEGTRAVMAGAPLLLDHLSDHDAAHFAEVCALLDAAGVAYEVDPTLVRGLDYYTRTVFEFTSDALGAQSGVGGGGRYDGLVEQLGGQPTPACGWAAGIERILLSAGDELAATPLAAPVAVVAEPGGDDSRQAFALCAALHERGIAATVDLAGRSLNSQRKAAARSGAAAVVTLTDARATLRVPGRDDREVAVAELPDLLASQRSDAAATAAPTDSAGGTTSR